MKLTPLADNVLIKSALEEETTASGIILATATKEKSIVSEVVSVGPGTEENPMTVKAGDKVIVAKFAGQELKLDGEDYSIVKVADILAVVE
ncbi:MAG: co-chaperone GroES [Oscillospiraceae bacterium]|nr:co-chaperone GroES [Oscillospiraceae bacterium]